MRRSVVALFCAVLIVAVLLIPGRAASAGPQGKLLYWVTADLVRGSAQPTGPVCVQTNVFRHGEAIVWRVRVLDVANGEDPGDAGKNIAAFDQRGITVTAYLENGQTIPLRYGQHPPRPRPGDAVAWFWAGSWIIPADYPTGTLRWWVVVRDKSGAFVRFDPIGSGTNLPGNRVIIDKGS